MKLSDPADPSVATVRVVTDTVRIVETGCPQAASVLL
jgi:hypothetical protein